MPVLKVMTKDVYFEGEDFLALRLNHPELKHVELRPNQHVVAVLKSKRLLEPVGTDKKLIFYKVDLLIEES